MVSIWSLLMAQFVVKTTGSNVVDRPERNPFETTASVMFLSSVQPSKSPSVLKWNAMSDAS